MTDHRIQISREEIGILMSYATRPDRLTNELVQRMADGVTGPELIEISSWIGLPESTAVRLVDANQPRTARTATVNRIIDNRFRRTLAGILIFMLVANVAFSIAADVAGVPLVLLTGAGALAAYLIYRLIVAIAPN